MLSRLLGILAGGLSATVSAAELPEDVQDFLMDPPAEVLSPEENDGIVPVTPAALALIRQIVLAWDPVESGAPRLDPDGPFGRAGADAHPTDIAKARAMVTLTHQLNDFTSRAVLKPGDYTPRNLPASALRQTFDWLEEDDAYLGLTAAGEVQVTDAHLKLVREMLWEWPNEYSVEDVLYLDGIPAPGIDGKRPYGDMSYYQLDVHRAQGWPVEKKTDDGYIALTDAQEADATRLHFQMLGVMQVFLENAELPE